MATQEILAQRAEHVSATDLDGDGDLDLAAANTDSFDVVHLHPDARSNAAACYKAPMRTRLDPKLDIVFKLLFGEERNKPLLISLLNCARLVARPRLCLGRNEDRRFGVRNTLSRRHVRRHCQSSRAGYRARATAVTGMRARRVLARPTGRRRFELRSLRWRRLHEARRKFVEALEASAQRRRWRELVKRHARARRRKLEVYAKPSAEPPTAATCEICRRADCGRREAPIGRLKQ